MLQLLNKTAFETGVGLFTDPEGKDKVTIVAKGTFKISKGPNGEIELTEEQLPALSIDEYYGKPGKSSVKYPMDVVLGKAATDAGLVGTAYSQDDTPVPQLPVSLRIGDLQKSILVIGNRYWKKNMLFPGFSISEPEPFTKMPVMYERAFGGIDESHEEKEKHGWHRENPIGTGFRINRHAVENHPLPNLEDPENLISQWKEKPAVMGYGFVDSSWEPRIHYAGTYDEAWQKNQSPLLPKDFKIDFFNSASRGLKAAQFLQGGERVELKNLSPSGLMEFTLPQIKINVTFHTNETSTSKEAKLWTVLIEPDENRFYLVWGASFPVGKQPSKMRYAEIEIQGKSAFSKEVKIPNNGDENED